MIIIRNRKRYAFLFLSLLIVAVDAFAQRPRPAQVLCAHDVQLMKESLGKSPLFDAAFKEARELVEHAIAGPIDVPVPIDAGGYTHEKHKQNYREMQLAGILFQVTGEERYAAFVRDMLLKYAKLYPTLGKHPMTASQEYGRLFWQTLNETVWAVHVAQAYDCVYDWMKPSEREIIEGKVLRPMAAFFTSEHAETIDRIHNHGTWMVAAVGMLGYALGDKNLVDIALYGTRKDGKTGFLRQMDLLFSPDGYYTEGAYYVRYAIMPFMVFAQVIENNQPELKIFERRDQILKKATMTALQLTDIEGRYVPINDALKEMSVLSTESVLAVDCASLHYGAPKELLAVAQKQGKVMLDAGGLAVANALRDVNGKLIFDFKSVEYTDGASGDEGGLGILRSGPVQDQTMLLMKYTAQGFGHGHFDKLSFLLYDQGREILQDYGAVRFINVETKFGGRYLPETETWAKQTIAHNTVTADGTSNYGGVYKVAQAHHADRHFFSSSDPDLQVVSGKAEGVYKGITMQRTMAMVRDKGFDKPLVIDIFRLQSDRVHLYDLPFYYMGHLVFTNIPYKASDTAQVRLGSSNGYQHLWKVAEGAAAGSAICTWLEGGRYYSIVSAADVPTQVLFARIGAGDPDFNLRNEPAVMMRRNAASTVFATVIEQHGMFEPVNELSVGAVGKVRSVRVLASTSEASIIEITGSGSLHWVFAVVNGPASDQAEHSLTVGTQTYSWKGNYRLWKN